MKESHLKVNDAKTEFTVIGTSHNHKKNMSGNIEIGEIKIHKTAKLKFLGVYLDELLNLKDNILNRTKIPTASNAHP